MYARSLVTLVAVTLATACLAQVPSAAEPISDATATAQLSGRTLALASPIGSEAATLRVVGPDGYELTKKFAGGPVVVDLVADQSAPTEPPSQPMTAAETATGLRDGRYAYHLSLHLGDGSRRAHSGSFEMRNGEPVASLPLPADGSEADPQVESGLPVANASEDDFFTVLDTAQDGETQLQLDSFPSGADFKYWLFRNDQGLLTLEAGEGFNFPVDILTVRSSGDLGVGTVPAADFEVVGNGGNIRFIDDDQPNFGDGWEFNDEGRLRVVALGNPGTASFYAEGGLFVGTTPGPTTPQAMLHVAGSGIIEGDVSMGSSRTIKHEIEPLDALDVLNTLRGLPIYSWKYTEDDSQATHTGPMAEDMYAAFQIGRDDKHLSPADSAGLALAAIKGVDSRLDREMEELRSLNTALVAESEALWERLRALEELLRSPGEH